MTSRFSTPAAAVAALFAFFICCSAAAQEQVLRLGLTLAKDSQLGAGAKRIARRCRQTVRGRYRVEIYPNGTVGGELEMIRDVQLGHLDMGFLTSAAFGSVIPEMGVFDMSFLFRDVGHARRTLDGPVGAEYLAKFSEHGMVGLAWGENGMRHMTNSKRPITRPEDLNGLKMRVPQSPVMLAAFKAMGADAQPLPFRALFGALQSGQFDGEENPLAVIVSSHFEKVQKHLTLTGHVYSWAVIIMSPQAWGALSAADRDIFLASAHAGGQVSRDAARPDRELRCQHAQAGWHECRDHRRSRRLRKGGAVRRRREREAVRRRRRTHPCRQLAADRLAATHNCVGKISPGVLRGARGVRLRLRASISRETHSGF